VRAGQIKEFLEEIPDNATLTVESNGGSQVVVARWTRMRRFFFNPNA
jgi:hypothetical protein